MLNGVTDYHRTGANTAFVFNHVTRAHSVPSDQSKLNSYEDIPAGHPHVDYCGDPTFLESTKKELKLPSEVASLYSTSSRYAYIGAWRPLKTLRKDPLAVCDTTSVPDTDYQLRLRDFRSGIKSGNYVMSHGEEKQQHQWYYMSGMTPDDIAVFKGYDTDQGKSGWRCPHTAITLPDSDHEHPRESIEARIVCFWQ